MDQKAFSAQGSIKYEQNFQKNFENNFDLENFWSEAESFSIGTRKVAQYASYAPCFYVNITLIIILT